MGDARKQKYVSFEIMKKYATNFEEVLRKRGFTEQADNFMIPFKNYGAEYADLEILPEWNDDVLFALEQAATGYRGKKGEIAAYRALINDPDNQIAKSIEALYVVMKKYLKSRFINGWIYMMNEGDGTMEAYLVTDIDYYKETFYGRGADRERHPPYIQMTAIANSADIGDNRTWRGVATKNFQFREEDLRKTVANIIYNEGIVTETKDLKDEYTKSINRFIDLQPKRNMQLLADGKIWPANRYDRYYGYKKKDLIDTKSFGEPNKVINDEDQLQRKFTLKRNQSFWLYEGVAEEVQVPIHPYVYCFDLKRHENCWIHADNLSVYQYDVTLKDKIVLPPEHTDLIEVLTADLDVLSSVGDVVHGKGGGTAILCQGLPGLGKTLTAEIYSEVVQKPLYKIHSGQLGTKPEEVEKNLEYSLKRAQNWGAVMLIDEADVYIRKRENDVNHNAIVACFLRTLEYFSGLLFMTTNRGDDVDDAIQSRMTAIVKYGLPSQEAAAQIWRIKAKQFSTTMPEDLIKRLTEPPMDKLSGRDINQILRLALRYVEKKKVALNYDMIRQCGMFSGKI